MFKRKHNWLKIREYYNNGHTIRECKLKFEFTWRTWSKAVKRGDICSRPLLKPISNYLQKGRRCSTSDLKRRLIDEGLLKNICSECGQKPIWNNKLLILHIDHKNGDITDNRIKNLRILCPHCHSQTSTYGSKNKYWKMSYKKQIKRLHKLRPSEDNKLI